MRPIRLEWPLVFFTTLTQMAAGAFFIWGFAALMGPQPNPFSDGLSQIVLAMVLASLAVGMLSAAAHLGYPRHGVFSLRHLQRSWLSREALFGLVFGGVTLGLWGRRVLALEFGPLDTALTVLGLVLGFGLVYSIARLYRLRTVPAWDHSGTPLTFFTTAILLGTICILAVWAAMGREFVWRNIRDASWLLLGLTAWQLVVFSVVGVYLNRRGGAAAESAAILWKNLGWLIVGRLAAAFLGVGLIFSASLLPGPGRVLAGCGLIFVSEVLGRLLFYGMYRRVGI